MSTPIKNVIREAKNLIRDRGGINMYRNHDIGPFTIIISFISFVHALLCPSVVSL